MLRYCGLIVCAAGLLAGSGGRAAAAPTCNDPEVLRLVGVQQGNSSAVVERVGNVTTDHTACYRMLVPAGRVLTVELFSDNRNGSLRLYNPTWTAGRGPNGAWMFTGNTLPRAGVGDHAVKWKGQSPIGNILVVIDMNGDGQQYRLRVDVE